MCGLIHILDSAGAVVKMRSVEMAMDADILQESIAILRKYARVLEDSKGCRKAHACMNASTKE